MLRNPKRNLRPAPRASRVARRTSEPFARRAASTLLACALLASYLLLPDALWRGIAPTARAANFVVENTNDSGAGSLRKAIADANASPGADTISFAINCVGPGCTTLKTIAPSSPLPPITEQLTIDGYTQAGASPNTLADGDDALLLVELNGQNAGASATGLDIKASNCVVRGLVINRFASLGVAVNGNGNSVTGNFIGTDAAGTSALGNGSGVKIVGSNNTVGGTSPALRNVISGNVNPGVPLHTSPGVAVEQSGSSNNVVRGNYIGTDRHGTAALGNGSGVSIAFGSGQNTVGGTSAAARNVISGSTRFGGVLLNSSSGNVIEGNYIGTDRTGTVKVGNKTDGIQIAAHFVGLPSDDNRVGGPTPAARNLISGNGNNGVVLNASSSPSVSKNEVAGNYIGTDAAGTSALGNGGSGVLIQAAGNIVGGSSAAFGNVISGNKNGVEMSSNAATGNTVSYNFIGTDATGAAPLGNSARGVFIHSGASGNVVGAFGGDPTLGGNRIAFNGTAGVALLANGEPFPAGNKSRANSIHSNGALGIDLHDNGPTPNDAGDADTGANNLQNFPLITSASSGGGAATVSYQLSGPPNKEYELEFFQSTACDPSGHGEGQTYLASQQVGADANGNANFSFPVAGATPGQFMTATATDAQGNTSEFSPCALITSSAAGTLQFSAASYSVGENAGTATITVTRAGGNVGPVSVNYSTSDGTATAGSDYTAASGTLAWADGDGASKTFGVGVTNDPADELNETVTLTLSGPSGGAALGTGASAALAINDNDNPPASLVVNTNDDSDDGLCDPAHCSLREAIKAANVAPDANVIGFGIPGGGVKTISPLTKLPAVTQPVTIDGYTQPGASPNTLADGDDAVLLIELDGTNVPSPSAADTAVGLFVSASNVTIRGLVINRFLYAGIEFQKPSANNTVEGNFIGTDPSGTVALGNRQYGIFIGRSNNNLVGGTAPASRNLITNSGEGGNRTGIIVSGDAGSENGTGNRIEGNFIGTNRHGTAALGNAITGVEFSAAVGNTVGGTAPGARNVISGNVRGIDFSPGAKGNVVLGNYIGTDVTGTLDVGNTTHGIRLQGGPNVVGGIGAQARNVISGNDLSGIDFISAAGGVVIRGNYIGTDASGTAALPNGAGVRFNGNTPSGNTVGGTAAGAGNLIAFNTGAGISSTPSGALDNSFLSNSIHSNGGLGIDLSPSGVTPNDADDADAGPNNSQNFPSLSSATLAGGAVSVSGALDSTADTQFRVEFFANAACDASGHGEGRTFVGAADVTTGAGGDASFNANLGGALAGQFITSTATDAAGSTSEFSPCVQVAEGDGGPAAPTVQFSSDNFFGTEDAHFVNVNVTRTGDTTQAATVDYSTTDGTASERFDYTTALGTLAFAPGEASKSFVVLITDDAYAEENETVQLTLSDPSGASLGAQGTATLIISGNDLTKGPGGPDAAEAFVREHYHDFLNREPDADGLKFWGGQLSACGEDAQCLEDRRVNVSASFFLSIEFQQTGFLVTRLHKVSYAGLPRYRPFLRDTQEVGRGVVVGEGEWEQQLKANKQALAERWAVRPEFLSAFGGLSDAEFVDRLFENAGVTPSQAERDALVAGLQAQTETRAAVLLKVAEGEGVCAGMFNQSFVLMQYFGYMRRNPDDPPDAGLGGFNFWLSKLDQFGGDYHQAEMVKAFISSIEYRQRFGPN